MIFTIVEILLTQAQAWNCGGSLVTPGRFSRIRWDSLTCGQLHSLPDVQMLVMVMVG